jgi:hypothetical protein
MQCWCWPLAPPSKSQVGPHGSRCRKAPGEAPESWVERKGRVAAQWGVGSALCRRKGLREHDPAPGVLAKGIAARRALLGAGGTCKDH